MNCETHSTARSPSGVVHAALGVREDPQRAHLVGQPVGLRLAVVVRDAEQHEQARADRRDLGFIDADGGPRDPLDECAHERGRLDAPERVTVDVMTDQEAISALVGDLQWQIDQMRERRIKNNAGHPYNPSFYKRGLEDAIDGRRRSRSPST